MPVGPGRTCGWPGCPRRTFDRDALCAVHRMQREARRGSAADRGYDAAWQEIRAVVLREEPFCRLCLAAGRRTASEHVDHIRPLRVGGTHARINLRALCASCHNRRTATEQSPGWRRTP
jgi:5-methylcytosine-specific restriction protein A